MSDQRKPQGPAGRPPPPPSGDRNRKVTDFDASPGSSSSFREAPATVVTPSFHRGPPTGATARVTQSVAATPASKAPLQAGYTDRAPRARVSVPVRYRYQSFIDFVETQSINVSRSGMFVSSDQPLPVGTLVQFEFALADGFVLLKGSAEVTRVSNTGAKGMGLKFVDLEEKSRKLIERIVEVNDEEGKFPTVPLTEMLSVAAAGATQVTQQPGRAGTSGGSSGAFAGQSSAGTYSGQNPYTTGSGARAGGSTAGSSMSAVPAATSAQQAVRWAPGKLRLVLNTLTAGYFTYNPLLNIKMGGFVVPCDTDVPLGSLYTVEIVDLNGTPMVNSKAKVVAKQERRLGIRLTEPDKAELARLQSEVQRLAPTK